MTARDSGWIFCGGMIRSGSTLQYQMASELIERRGLGRRTIYVAPQGHGQALAGLPPEGWSTFKTHEFTPAVERHCVAGTGVALYSFRDIRDVLSSYQRKEGITLDQQRTEALIASLLERDARWRALPRVHLARYEDFILGLAAEVRRLAGFLDLPCADAECRVIAGALSYEAQQGRIASAAAMEMVEINASNAYHPQTLLHGNHLQGGIIGRYRVELATQQRRLVERLAGSWLDSHGYSV